MRPDRKGIVKGMVKIEPEYVGIAMIIVMRPDKIGMVEIEPDYAGLARTMDETDRIRILKIRSDYAGLARTVVDKAR